MQAREGVEVPGDVQHAQIAGGQGKDGMEEVGPVGQQLAVIHLLCLHIHGSALHTGCHH